jgi:archaellum component FlaG (FlaF/FlaG flagellin family)
MNKKILMVGVIGLFLGLAVAPSIDAGVSTTMFSITCMINPLLKRSAGLTNGYSVELSCDDPYQTVPSEAGASTTFSVEITNTGTRDDTYDVTAGSIEDIMCLVNGEYANQFTPYPITLAAGESMTFDLTAELYAAVPIGEWSVYVYATSQNNTCVSDVLELIVNVVKNGYSVDVSCNDPYQTVPSKTGASTTFLVKIKNTGTLDDTYNVTAGSIEDITCLVNGKIADQFTPYPISLATGESLSFNVTAELYTAVPVGEWPVYVSATSQNNTGVSDGLELIVNVAPFEASLEIGSADGGLLEVDAEIKNTGYANATHVEWSISVEGGIRGRIQASGKGTLDTLAAQSSEWVRYPSGSYGFDLVGFGPVIITVTAQAEGIDEVTKTMNGFVVLFFVIIPSE